MENYRIGRDLNWEELIAILEANRTECQRLIPRGQKVTFTAKQGRYGFTDFQME